MSPSRLFIQRPVATSLLMLAVLLAGLVGWRLLPVAALPQVDYPTIQVTTLYPGASPDVMTSSVTAPLERQFGQMPGLAGMSSSSSGGASVITLRFDLGLSLDVAEQEVQAAINAGGNLLPSDLPMPPVYSKVNPADAPVLTIAVSSPTLPITRVQDLVESRLAQKISQVPGVGLVSIAGGRRPAVRIQADPDALARLGFSLEDLRNAIGSANVNQAKGGFDGPLRASTLDANDQLKSAAEYGNVVFAYRNGAPVRVGDVATLVDDAENLRLAAWAGSSATPGPAHPLGDSAPAGLATAPLASTTAAVILNVQRQPGANVIDTVDRVKAALPQLRAALPGSVDVQVLGDRTTTIRASVEDVQFELLLSIVLVVAVIWLFLRSARATVIPAVAVPLSLVGTFGVMQLAGFSVNNLTLMAMVIATGFVVDDAIVMIENIARHIEMGKPPMQAALEGASEIGFTIISLTVSLIAVLIPLLFMGDVVGRLFHEFAITLAVSIVISALVSLTLTPMMSARLLRPEHEEQPNALARWVAQAFDRAIGAYARLLDWALAHRGITLSVFGATLALSALLYVAVPKGFFPVQDTGQLQGITEAAQSVSFAAMAERQQALAARLLEDPAVASVASFIGVDGGNTTLNNGRLQVVLKPLSERGDDATAVARRLMAQTQHVPGISLHLQPVQDLTLDDRLAKAPYHFTLSGPDASAVNEAASRVVERLRTLGTLAQVSTDQQTQGLQAWLDIDREAAGRLGVTVAAIDAALYDAYGQRLISTIFTQSNQYRVVLEVAPQFRHQLTDLGNLHVPGANGAQVPLSSVASVQERLAPLSVNHVSQFPSVTVSFDTSGGTSLGAAVQSIEHELATLSLPASVEVHFDGAAASFQSSLSSTLVLIGAAVVTMYIVLGVLYESFVHPVTILSTLPSAGVGALLALMVTRLDLGIIGIIGIVLLIGIVKKNAIMMIDFALDAQRHQGLPALQAIRQACLLRFRPILMTTMAALLGALPLMLGGGVGSELRRPLGVVMVGGLIVSQLLTLFSTPVIYLAFDTLRERWARRENPSRTQGA